MNHNVNSQKRKKKKESYRKKKKKEKKEIYITLKNRRGIGMAG